MEESNKELASVPYLVYESAQARAERTAKRLTIALIVAIILIFASNALWLYEWCQYDYVGDETTEMYHQDGSGYNNINTGSQGDVTNGADVYQNNEIEEPEEEVGEFERNKE